MATTLAPRRKQRPEGKAVGTAFHQQWEPVPVLTLDPDCIGPSVDVLAAKIASIRKARWCGAYLFIAPTLEAYVVSEEKPAALHWVRTKRQWLVGLYGSQGQVVRDVLASEAAKHLQGLGLPVSNNSATVGRDQCDGPSVGVGNPTHSVTGLARGAGPDAIPAGAGSGEGASTPARVSGEAADHG